MFGTLTVPEVIAAGPTAIAVAAQPVLGQAGYWLMTVTALFATAGATNAGLYPATGLSDHLASTGQFPDLMARRIGGVAPAGLVIAAAGIILLVVLFDLSAVASIGSAVALGIFALVTIGHLRIRADTGANLAPAAAGARHDRRHAADVRVHDAHPGAGLDPHARGDRRHQHRDRPVVGARPGATRRGGPDAIGDGDEAGRPIGARAGRPRRERHLKVSAADRRLVVMNGAGEAVDMTGGRPRTAVRARPRPPRSSGSPTSTWTPPTGSPG